MVPQPPPPPDPWLVHSAPALGPGPRNILDLACGTGRNALWLARTGHQVVGIDESPEQIEEAREYARRQGLTAGFAVRQVAAGSVPCGPWDGICVFHFLDRALFPELKNALTLGGCLVYKTHLAHPLRAPDSRPQNPNYLLGSGELWSAFPGLTPLCYREWSSDGHVWAGILARKTCDYSS